MPFHREIPGQGKGDNAISKQSLGQQNCQQRANNQCPEKKEKKPKFFYKLIVLIEVPGSKLKSWVVIGCQKIYPPGKPKSYMPCNAVARLFGKYKFLCGHRTPLFIKCTSFGCKAFNDISILDITHFKDHQCRLSSIKG
jgi:hypothetical protein